ncbi:MAG: hypothetical protein Kow0069_37560 [Promethearchaeota archaeon]
MNEEIHPILADVQASLEALKSQQAHLETIFEDWAEEQRELLEIGREEVRGGFAQSLEQLRELERALSPALSDLQASVARVGEDVRTGLAEVNRRLGQPLAEACGSGLAGASLEEAECACRVQLQGVQLAGKFDRPYEEEEFVPTPELDEDFRTFVWKSEDKPLFLLLARVGMGKTWNAAHLTLQVLREASAFAFFFPLQYGFREQLRAVFPNRTGNLVEDVARECEAAHAEHARPVLLTFDGLDEARFSSDAPGDFLAFLSRLLDRCRGGAIHVLLTDRLEDWANTGVSSGLGSHVCVNPVLEAFRRRARLPTPVSFHLRGFTKGQLEDALAAHGLLKLALPEKLRDACRVPYVLRLVAERRLYPDPDDAKAFFPLFYDPDPAVETILKRLDLSDDDGLAVLGDLLTSFAKAGGMDAAVPYSEVRKLATRYRAKWQTLVLGGLLGSEGTGLSKRFVLVPTYRGVMGELARVLGVQLEAGVPAPPATSGTSATVPAELRLPSQREIGQKFAVCLLGWVTEGKSPYVLREATKESTPDQRRELVEITFGPVDPHPLRVLRTIASLAPEETAAYFSDHSKRGRLLLAMFVADAEDLEADLASRLVRVRAKKWTEGVEQLGELVEDLLGLPDALAQELAATVVAPELGLCTTVEPGTPAEAPAPQAVDHGGWRLDANAVDEGVKLLSSLAARESLSDDGSSNLGHEEGPGPEAEAEPEPSVGAAPGVEPGEAGAEGGAGEGDFFAMGVRMLDALGFERPEGDAAAGEPEPGPDAEPGPEDFIAMGVQMLDALGIGKSGEEKKEKEKKKGKRRKKRGD